MRDRYFYPLAVLVIIGIVALAFVPGERTPGQTEEDIRENGYELAGPGLEKLTAAPTTFATFIKDAQGETKTAILSSNMAKDKAPASAGVFGMLGKKYDRVFRGQNMQITVRARAGSTKPLDRFFIGYFTDGAGSTGWRPFELSSEFQDYQVNFKLQKPPDDPVNNYVGIWPGESGQSETMEVERIQVRIVQP